MNTRSDVDGLGHYLNIIMHSIPLSREKEAELALRIHEGDAKARNELVEANLRFVVSVAREYQGRGLTMDELVSAGNTGLVTAAERFDETRGFKFISYAVWWIRQAMLQAIAKDRVVPLSAGTSQLLLKISKAARELQHSGCASPTTEDIAGNLGIAEDEVERSIVASKPAISLDAEAGGASGSASIQGDPGNSLFERRADESAEPPDEVLDQEDMRAQIDAAVYRLPRREAEVLRLYFGLDGELPMTLEQIGHRLDVTRERARQIKERALHLLRAGANAKRLAVFDGAGGESARLDAAEALRAKYTQAHRKCPASNKPGARRAGRPRKSLALAQQ
ncbi:MAG: sigma-70 family RNA polymerase sigma factor [Parcubacteria group bacterium]|nr:sigma-70 family RNA polymerase sigma factor [Parcubacteria group bacterium]